MTTITCDTLKLARKLEAAGFAPKQAADTAEALAESMAEVSGVATRQDLAELKADLLKWMFTTALAQAGAIVALLKIL